MTPEEKRARGAAYSRKYRERHPDRIRESNRKYRESHREQIRTSKQVYREANRGRIREAAHRWYLKRKLKKAKESLQNGKEKNRDSV